MGLFFDAEKYFEPDPFNSLIARTIEIGARLKNDLFLYLSQTRVFWRLRSVLLRLRHGINVKGFGVRYSAKEGKSNFHTLRAFTNHSQIPLFAAVGFALLLQYLDPYLAYYYHKAEFYIPDDGDYVTLLATISGIGGVFIGLYYAGITAVGSAIYASVPNNVRDLLAQDRFGNVYMRFLSFLTFVGLVLIALRISGQPRVFLAIPVVTIAAGIGIISSAIQSSFA